ncbi:MAG: hypothetical protein K1X56_12525 [Flavobacteriales bacterium]|nr:hypothetical protein [Flavobacteriales bacterium]
MIQFHMLTREKKVCDGIADIILKDNYSKDIRIEEMIQQEWDATSQKRRELMFYRITCLMKSTLFTPLVSEVTEKYGTEPRMFSLPVTQIEDDWAMEIRNSTRKI